MNPEESISPNREVLRPAAASYIAQRARFALLLAIFFIIASAQAATNVWSGLGSDNTWTNTGNWYGSYAAGNTNQFTNGAATINFSTSTSSAGILLTDTATTVTVTNPATTITLSGSYGLDILTGTLSLNIGTITLGAAQTWAVATGAAINIGANVNKATFLLTIANDDNVTINGIISSSGGLTKSGVGTLTLSRTNTYTGTTTITDGTLALSSSGLLSASTSIDIAAGAIFDVSGRGASATYTLGNSASLTASGTGTGIGSTAATITGGASGTISLGSRPITLNYDGANPALYISQGTLSLNGNAFTVNSASPLAIGSYPIIHQASGNITSSGTFTVSGTAIGFGTAASIQVSGGNVNLVVVVRPPFLAITSVNGGANPTAGTGFNVVVQSQYGTGTPTNVSANTGVTLSRTTGSGTLGGTLTGVILAGNNSTTISGVTYTKAESGVVLTATRTSGDTLSAGSSATFTVNAGAATAIALTSGNSQTGSRWTPLANPFVVTTTDAFGNPASGAGVTFALGTSPGGATGQSLSTSSTTSDSNGQASTKLTLGSVVGAYTVTATSGSLSGSPVTFTATAGPSDYIMVASATNEFQICLKCHSGYSFQGNPPTGLTPNGTATNPVETDQAQEFNPMNKSGHPVVTGLDNYSNSIAVGGKRGLLAADLIAPWNVNIGQQTMMCTDCHNTDSASPAAQGPHGSAAQFMLRTPNAGNWPNVQLRNFASSWCANCHTKGGGNADSPHYKDEHQNFPCYYCHIVIPHGGKMSRLIADNDTMPSRYAYNNTLDTNSVQAFTKTSINGYQDVNCRAQCHGTGPHRNQNPNENW